MSIQRKERIKYVCVCVFVFDDYVYWKYKLMTKEQT